MILVFTLFRVGLDGTYPIKPPPLSLFGHCLSILKVFYNSGLPFQCFLSATSLSHVWGVRHILFGPKSRIRSWNVNLLCSKLHALMWKNFSRLLLSLKNFVTVLKQNRGPGFDLISLFIGALFFWTDRCFYVVSYCCYV